MDDLENKGLIDGKHFALNYNNREVILLQDVHNCKKFQIYKLQKKKLNYLHCKNNYVLIRIET